RMRAGGVFAGAGPVKKGGRVPRLPRLGGAGPIAWRQLIEIARNRRGLVAMLMMLAFWVALFIGLPLLTRGHGRQETLPVEFPITMVLIMSAVSTQNLMADFRRDIDRMALF